MAKQATAKTPTVAIARVLRGLGLKQGLDFTVRGSYTNGERTGTTAYLFGQRVRTLVADHADEIEAAVQLDGGFVFNVSIRYYDSRPWPTVSNYGDRTREAAPVVATVPMKVTVAAPVPAFTEPSGEIVAHQTKAELEARAAQPTGAHPYEGLAQRPFGSLTWACEEAGQVWFFQNTSNSPRYTLRVYHGRAQINGWYLSGDRVGRAFLGATLTIAAMAAQPVILLADKLALVAQQWPEGTRVSYPNSKGITVTGTVNGHDVGSVTITTHENFGRTYVGVTADPTDSIPWGQRERPFTDLLTRI